VVNVQGLFYFQTLTHLHVYDLELDPTPVTFLETVDAFMGMIASIFPQDDLVTFTF
jgi:hypothetical protein